MDDDPDNPPPSKPPGLDVALAVDVSPMRPDAWLRQRQMPWMRAVLDQNASQDAVNDVRQEADGFLATAEMT